MGNDTEIVDDGPWRATRLWNSIIRNLQDGIPLKRHRRQLKTHEKCFTGIEATEWLHKHLKKNPNFGGEVSKEQTILLLQKLVRAGVVLPINLDAPQHLSGMFQKYPAPVPCSRGDDAYVEPDYATHVFRSNNDLYRLAEGAVDQLRTPRKDSSRKKRPHRDRKESSSECQSTNRTPLAQIKVNKNDTVGVGSATVSPPASGFRASFRRNKNKLKKKALDFKENDWNASTSDGLDQHERECYDKYSVDQRKSMNLTYIQSLPPNSLVVLDNDSTWNEVFTNQLKLILSDVHVRGLNLNTANIIYNMTNVSPKGVVQIKNLSSMIPSEKNNQQQDLPQWTLSAMKCLANWPKQIKLSGNDAEGSSFPTYQGFEQDVFEVVKDYFLSQMNRNGPLTTYKLFDIFVSAYIKAEAIGAKANTYRRTNNKSKSNTNRNIVPSNGHNYNIETDLDSGCFVQTSTPSSSVDKASLVGRNLYPLPNNELAQSTFYKMTSSPNLPSVEYGVSNRIQKRTAKIRPTFEVCTNEERIKRNGLSSATSNTNQSSSSRSISLTPEMSATAIMRNFLPPNTCFETVFMNECPVTRIVPQKGSETLHHLQRTSKFGCGKNQIDNENLHKHKCYTPIPSGGSIITSSAWDSRSIATQTEDEDEEKGHHVEKDSKSRSRQPRWKRSARKRKSIAVMETSNSRLKQGLQASPAKSESGLIGSGKINRGFSVSPMRGYQDYGNLIGRPRSASTLPYNASRTATSSNISPSEQIYSNSLDNLLTNHKQSYRSTLSQPLDAMYSVVVPRLSPASCQESTSPTENMIRSKTVRAEKRKQRDRREKSGERFIANNEENFNGVINNHVGQHVHPTGYSRRPQSMATFNNQYCYANPAFTGDQLQQKPGVGYMHYGQDIHRSPNDSKSSGSSLIGSASNYNHMSKSTRSFNPPLNGQHHLFHHQNGLSVKTPLTSCPAMLDQATIPFMDDTDMLYARAEPYQPSLSSELELQTVNSKSMSEEGISSAIASFQLLGLLIPPSNRRKLQLLLKFMRRLASKEKLRLMSNNGVGSDSSSDYGYKSCSTVVLDVFTETIIKPNQDYSNGDIELSRKIVQFFLDHYDDVWTPPAKLRKEVGERVYQSLVSKRLEAGEDPFPITFCKRVPSRVYEREKQGQALDTAMLNLLEQILFDVKMSMKEKKKKVKKFKESYPNIYYMRFPTEDSEPDYMQSNQAGPMTRMSSLAKLKNAIRM